jgi:hypothetical protein
MSASWEAAAGEQLLGWADLRHLAVLDHGDLVRFDHGGESVRDHDGGPSLT